jgi:hypothetical protein
MKKLIYVAGAYRADGWNDVYENIHHARAEARKLWLKNWVVICPHANTFLMDGPDIDPKTFIEGDLVIVERCDAIMMLDGWEHSEGSQEEYCRAMELEMPIYFGEKNVPDLTGEA